MWPLFLARKQLFPPGKFPVFATVSILGVALGVMALLVVQTVMNSFGEEHRRRIRESSGDVVVLPPPAEHGSETPVFIRGAAALCDGIERAANAGVVAASPVVEGAVVTFVSGGKLELCGALGVDPAREERVTPLRKYLEPATCWEDFDDERVIVGAALAARLGLAIGDTLPVASPARLLKNAETERKVLPKELTVCGILKTGFQLVDDKTLLVTLRTGRELFELPAGTATSLRLKLRDHRRALHYDEMETLANGIARLHPDVGGVKPWTFVRQAFLAAIDMEKQILFFLMFIITLVASFSIGSTLFSHVVRRTREIGLLGALGARPPHILALFLAQGLLIGVLGYGLGAALAWTLLHFRQNIVSLFGMDEIMAKQYLFSQVPLHYNPADFAAAAVLTIFLMTVVSLLPALWAAGRKPSEAMRDAN
ncbi:MAG: ABC transporter permease [Puniceicoccales bacterium]|jgi:lipoprotein-releasing system permease protein|nr:ABC transporter permease [Puniceicoccales bacterium]